MERFLNKKYRLVHRDEHFNDFLKAIGSVGKITFKLFSNCNFTGLNWLDTKIAKQIPTIVELTKTDDGFYHLRTDIKVYTHDQKFQPGVEIQQKSVEGSLVKNLFWFEGNRLIEKQFGAKTVIRQFSATDIQATLSCDNVTTKTYSEIIF